MAALTRLISHSSLMGVAVVTGTFIGQAAAGELNPQPEPPGTAGVLVAPHSGVMLNPQPEPPGVFRMHRSTDWLGLNPQPEPPGEFTIKRPGDWQGLNPQPEPP